jgi:KDO2-lipid IV(A) lauroyltransferase
VKPVRFRYRVEFVLVMAVRGVAGALPDVVANWIGNFVGLCFYTFDPAHRRLAISQLRAAFPVRSEADCRQIARATFRHFGRLLVVLLKFSTFSAAQVRARVEYDGTERVRAALQAGKGVLLFSGHFGYWELQGIAHPLALPPMSVLARPLDNPYLHALLERTRRTTGNGVIYRRGAVRRVLRALANNEIVAIMIDQHMSEADAVMVEFFNRPAATSSALAALALRTGAPLIPVFALPLGAGRYRMIYEHPVELPPADSPDPVHELTQRCTDVLEMYVRRHPHLWLWMHRRWRDVGADEKVPGMFPSAVSDDDDQEEVRE